MSNIGKDMNDFDKLCKMGHISGPVTDVRIINAEADLGVRFPDEYRVFLQKYGAVLADSVAIYGLCDVVEDEPPLYQDVTAVTKQLRNWQQAGADRPSFIAFCDDGTGVYFFMDTSASPETQIWAIGPGIERTFQQGLFRFSLDLSEGRIIL